jgi:hypothetical protein
VPPPRPALPGTVWDGRFRLDAAAGLPAGTEVGALGSAAEVRRLPAARALPAAVRWTLPALRCQGRLYAVPHLGWPDGATAAGVRFIFAPPVPAAPAPFLPASGVLA